MMLDLPGTTVSSIDKTLNRLRKEGGVTTIGRVLTLIIQTASEDAENIIEAANEASREHPCRVIVLIAEDPHESTRLDAQIRIGGDAGASEVIVLRAYGSLAQESESLVSGLLLPDAPIVLWWPDGFAKTASERSMGRMATRRITDSMACSQSREALLSLADYYRPGDTDLAWTRLTPWRAQLAAVFDLIDPQQISRMSVEGLADSPSAMLLAAWLEQKTGAPVSLVCQETQAPVGQTAISSVKISLPEGEIELVRANERTVELHQPGQPIQRISLPLRSLSDCLAEELRRLDPDDIFSEVLHSSLIRRCSL